MGGRRTKYRQASPVPLPDPDSRPSPKRLGKRKLNVELERPASRGPAKRAKVKGAKKVVIEEPDGSSDTPASLEASPEPEIDALTSEPNQLWSSEDEDEDSEGEDEHVTMGNMEKRSRALDAEAAREAELDMEEMQNAGLAEEDEDEDEDEDEGEPFHLPTTEEREEEKKGVSDVQVVQRRMRHCVRVLRNFKKLAEEDRSDVLLNCHILMG